MFQRTSEHQEGLRTQNKDSTLWQHCLEAHEGRTVEFRAVLIRKHRTALTRQIHEMVAISVSKSDYTLNRRDDWNSARNPRLVVEVRGEIVQEEGEKGAKRGGEQDTKGAQKKPRMGAKVPNTLPSILTMKAIKRADSEQVIPPCTPKAPNMKRKRQTDRITEDKGTPVAAEEEGKTTIRGGGRGGNWNKPQ